MMRVSEDFKTAAIALMLFGGLIGFLTYGGQDILGIDIDDTRKLVTLLPAVILVFTAVWTITQSSGFMNVISFGCLGVAIAFGVYSLDSVDLIIPDLVQTASEIGIIVIFVLLCVGSVVAWLDK